jgi:hypothetical protein
MKKLLMTAIFLGIFSSSYAQSDYYNDYRRSVTDINWQSVISDLLLTPAQSNQVYALNDRYSDYNSWNRVYVNNPDRWREDRYVELERILGRDKYAKFKNKYYKGQNPVAVYNRNKNNDKRYKHMNNKVKANKPKHHGKNHH